MCVCDRLSLSPDTEFSLLFTVLHRQEGVQGLQLYESVPTIVNSYDIVVEHKIHMTTTTTTCGFPCLNACELGSRLSINQMGIVDSKESHRNICSSARLS